MNIILIYSKLNGGFPMSIKAVVINFEWTFGGT